MTLASMTVANVRFLTMYRMTERGSFVVVTPRNHIGSALQQKADMVYFKLIRSPQQNRLPVVMFIGIRSPSFVNSQANTFIGRLLFVLSSPSCVVSVISNTPSPCNLFATKAEVKIKTTSPSPPSGQIDRYLLYVRLVIVL